MSNITKDEVEKIAVLARLELTQGENDKFREELAGILGYIDTIQKADTKNVEPTTQVTGLTDVFREDEKKESLLDRDDIFFNAPEKKDGYIKVKSVLE